MVRKNKGVSVHPAIRLFGTRLLTFWLLLHARVQLHNMWLQGTASKDAPAASPG